MRWIFTPHAALSEADRLDLETIPGIKIKRTISVPENALAVVRDYLTARGIKYSFEMPRDGQRELLKDASRVRASMRAEVPGYGTFPDFLTPYQRAGLAASLKWPNTSGLLLWSTGSGKTLGAILWGLAGQGRIIVVTKAAVKYQWAGEVRKFTNLTPLVLEGEKPAQIGIEAPIVILNYDILPAWLPALGEWTNWMQIKPSLIFDESSSVQSHKRWDATVDTADDSKVKFSLKDNIAAAAMRLSGLAARRLATTATPIRDRVRNLWGQIDLVHPGEWGPYWPWAKRYCGAREGAFGGMDDSGATNLAELKTRLEVVTHRVKHEEANALLPPKRRIVSYIPIQEQVRAAGATAEIRAALKAGNPTLIRECLLMEAAGRKRRWLTSRVKAEVEAGAKVVVFTGRRRDCDDLLAALAGAAPLVVGGHGGNSAEEREAMRVRYMEAPGPAILVGTVDAWGTGLNLHDTDRLMIAMLPYVPAAVIQAEGRVCRLGQRRPVIIEYGVCEGTIDERVSEILLTKLPALEKVIDQDEIKSFGRELIGADDPGIMENLAAKILAGARRKDED